MQRSFLPTALLACSYAATGAGAEVMSSGVGAYYEQVSQAGLSETVYNVDRLRLELGPGVLQIVSGNLYPAPPVDGTSREFVFVGDARLRLEPPDDVESGQLQFFVDEARLDLRILSGVLVIASDRALEAIAERPTGSPSKAEYSLARATFSSWVRSPEREVLAVKSAIVRDLHADPAYEEYFCAWLLSRNLGRVVYLVDPEAREQVTLGRFEKVRLSDEEQRRIERQLHREQRQGRLMGVSLDRLGRFDTWLSMYMPDPEGVPRAGSRPFDVQHYGLELEVLPDRKSVRAKARVEFTGRRPMSVVRLGLHPALEVDAVADSTGALEYLTADDELLVFLREAITSGQQSVVEVSYGGPLIERDGPSTMVASTLDWYPNAGTADRATFDVLFRWPQKLDLLASGAQVDAGEDEAGRWQRRALTRPSGAFGFEVGRFKTETIEVGGVPITFATDREGRVLAGKRSREVLLAAIGDAFDFYVDIFGDFPYAQLTLVTTGREFSQSLPGFITLSSRMLIDDNWLALYSRLEDPRGLIGHEIAHQWWGHRVAFAGYRDVWLSEGMANYAAMLYLRKRVPNLRFGRGPTSGWRADLTEQLEDGTTIEDVGPVWLGKRLNSSRATAYEPIVYSKGALVLGMLARGIGEERFLDALRILIGFVDARDLALTTEDFVALLGKITQDDLGPFADEFVFGTGLPSIEYEYEIRQTDSGWRLQGRAARASDLDFDYRVVEVASGRLDVQRQVSAVVKSRETTLYLPFRVAISVPENSALAHDGMGYRFGRLVLSGDLAEFAFDFERRPHSFTLDPYDEVFALTRDLGLYPKRRQLTRGLEALAAGDVTVAEQEFERVSSSPVYAGERSMSPQWVRDESDSYDARAHRELCRLALAAGDTAGAAEHLARAGERMSPRQRKSMKYRVLEARLALRRDDPATAYEILEQDVYRNGEEHLEASLVFAIAATEAGLAQQAESVLARLDDRPAEYGVLTARMTG